MNVQLYNGVTGWIKPNTERIVSKQLYASARRVQWKHAPQLELSLYIRVLFFFLMMKPREYRRNGFQWETPHRRRRRRRRINSSHSHFCNLKRNERQFSPEQFYGVNYFRWKKIALYGITSILIRSLRPPFLSSYFDPIPPRRGKLNENKNELQNKKKKKKRNPRTLRHEKEAQQINNKPENFLLGMKYERFENIL